MSANASASVRDLQCTDIAAGRYVLTAAACAYALVTVPLSVSVLYVGVRRSLSSAAAMSHSDFFTYNMAVLEPVGAVGFIFASCPDAAAVGVLMVSCIWPGQTLLPVLTCAERYLAVVHPVTYRGLRHAGAAALRNLSTGFIWVGCFVWLLLLLLLDVAASFKRAVAAVVLVVSLAVMMFCCLSVVRILIRPHPGGRGQTSQSKRRAALTVLLTMAVLWFKFSGNAMVIVSRFSPVLGVRCAGEALTFVFYLPSAVVLPLLLLHRAGKHGSGSAGVARRTLG